MSCDYFELIYITVIRQHLKVSLMQHTCRFLYYALAYILHYHLVRKASGYGSHIYLHICIYFTNKTIEHICIHFVKKNKPACITNLIFVQLGMDMDRKCHIARHTFVDRKADIIGGGHTWLTKRLVQFHVHLCVLYDWTFR